MLHSETIYFIKKSNFYGTNLPPHQISKLFVKKLMVGGDIYAYCINMQGYNYIIDYFYLLTMPLVRRARRSPNPPTATH